MRGSSKPCWSYSLNSSFMAFSFSRPASIMAEIAASQESRFIFMKSMSVLSRSKRMALIIWEKKERNYLKMIGMALAGNGTDSMQKNGTNRRALSRISVSLRVSGFERSAAGSHRAACHATFSLPYLRIGKEKLDQKFSEARPPEPRKRSFRWKCPRVAGLFLVKLFGGVTKWSREKGLAHPLRRLCRSPLPAFD